MDTESKKSDLAELKARVTELEAQIAAETEHKPFRPTGYYTAYYATTGFMLGSIGAMASLLFNVVGSVLTGKHPLELIRTYLTFPLGDQVFALPEAQNGLMLAIGCCLYIGTGMVLGIPVYLALTRWAAGSSLSKKLAVATVVSLIIWVINFYGILSWLQPAVIEMSEENLIVNRVPWWVAAATHLIFGWTLALVYPLGDFIPYERVSEQK
ncbi:hypothetical protein [Adhaeretor mobilis]|uniref:Uncharacterized protein n=1 Tax=Adhaeretor mobilis TaxID=1930276 RepID=A0A517MV88_9BACT|nr:hypothetical protein [Adhaeretor mobilis]QDS98788.1 hypothetical protein HG15A2_20730 [Adhaeretor mobilis]